MSTSMPLRALRPAVIFAVLVLPVFGQTGPQIKQQANRSSCSNIVAVAGNVNINCSSLTPEQSRIIESIPDILKKILRSQLDPKEVMAALNQIHSDVSGIRSLIPITTGELFPASDPDPPSTCSAPPPSNALKVFLGSSTGYTTGNSLDVVTLGNKSVLSLERSESGAILINAAVRSPDGRIITEIKSGKFYVNPNNYYRTESDRSNLTIYNQEGNVALKVSYLNPSSVYVEGDFIADGRRVTVVRDALRIGGAIFSGACAGNPKSVLVVK